MLKLSFFLIYLYNYLNSFSYFEIFSLANILHLSAQKIKFSKY